MDWAGEDEEYVYYVIHDSIGVSHFLREKKGKRPMVRCKECDD